MSRTLTRWPAALLLWLGLATPLLAQGGTPRPARAAVTIVAENITARDLAAAGHPRAAADSGKLLAGDVVEYRLLFSNTSSAPVKNVVLDDPLPKGLVYVEGTATADANAEIEYSVDGGRTYSAQPTVRAVVNGQEVAQPAPAALYTNVRWRLTGAVSPGARVTASFRARLGAGDRQ